MIIKALVDDHNPLLPFGHLIDDAKFSSHSFNQLIYSYTKKVCNFVAHSLARFVVDILVFLIWMEDVFHHSFILYF